MTRSEVKIELIPPHIFEGEGRGECLADLYQSVGDLLKRKGSSESRSRFLERLPIVDWTLCEGVPGYVTVRLFAKRTPDGDLPSFAFQMVNRRVLGGRHVEIFTSQHVVFSLPDVGRDEFVYLAMAIHVERQAELAEFIQTLPCLAPDLELGALAPEFATPLQQALLPEESADLSQVRCKALRWLRRWDEAAPGDLLREFSSFACAAAKPFREVRSNTHLTALFKRLSLLRKSVLRRWNLTLDTRSLRLMLFSSALHYPFGNKEVLGAAIATCADRKHETFEEDAAKAALAAILPQSSVVEGSFFSYHPPREVVRLIYFEIEKLDQSSLSSGERILLQRRLPAELGARITTLSHSLFMPRNEEEVLRSVLGLSGEMRSKHTPPQVVISFEELGVERLTFTLILVRLLKAGAPTASDIANGLPADWKVHFEQDRILGALHKVEKSASVFTVSLPNALFLRRDRSVDLSAARTLLISELARLLPGLTDYHGGLMLKQEKILQEAKKLVSGSLPEYAGLLEELFYSLSPAIMQSYLQPRLIARLFSSTTSIVEQTPARHSSYQLATKSGEGAFLIAVRARSADFLAPLKKAVDGLAFDPLQVALASAAHAGSHFACCLYLSDDQVGAKRLLEAVSQALQEWTEEQKRRQILRLTIPREETSLDPRIGVDRRSGVVIKMLYEGLMRLEAQGTAFGIASDVAITPDQKRYTFTLRPSYWSNGDPVTSADFEYAWKKVLDPEFSSRYAYLFYPIKGAQAAKEGRGSLDEVGILAASPRTLVVELTHPLPSFLELVTHWTYSPVHRLLDSQSPDWAEAKGDLYVCNGPFRLSDRSPDRGLVLSKNAKYWAQDQVHLEEIQILPIGDPATNLALFERGELDWIGDPLVEIPTKDLIDTLGKEKVQAHPVSAVFWFELNVECFPFDSKAMRKAFAAALDRDDILKKAGLEGNAPAISLFPPSMVGLSQTALPARDIEHARHLFSLACEERGVNRKRLPQILCCYAQLAGQQQIAEAIAQQWREVLGVSVVVKGYPWEGYLDRMRSRDFHAGGDTLVSWYSDPLYNLRPFSSRFHSLNTTRWENEEYARLLEEAERILDPERKKSLASQAERLLLDEAVVLPISYRQYRYAVREGVYGIFLSTIGQIDFSRAYISQIPSKGGSS